MLILLSIEAWYFLYFIASRPDFSYSVGVCARCQANPKESHVIIVKRIIKYVKSTSNFGVWYDNDTNDVLARYFNADCASNSDDRKSTFGRCFYLGNNIVSWMSKRQNSIYLLTAEVEYIATGSCYTQLLWMQELLLDNGICQKHLIIYCDNTNAINISKHPVQHSWTKYIEIRHHFICELVEDDILTLEFINTDD